MALMQIVPANAKLVVAAEISPKDIADVKVGMLARVTLTAYSTRSTPPVEGHVTLVSADAKVTGPDGKDCKLEDLKKGQRIRVTTKEGDKKVATRVEALKGDSK